MDALRRDEGAEDGADYSAPSGNDSGYVVLREAGTSHYRPRPRHERIAIDIFSQLEDVIVSAEQQIKAKTKLNKGHIHSQVVNIVTNARFFEELILPELLKRDEARDMKATYIQPKILRDLIKWSDSPHPSQPISQFYAKLKEVYDTYDVMYNTHRYHMQQRT